MLFDLLENAGLLRGSSVNEQRIESASLTEIADWAAQSAEITSAASMSREESAFAHSASFSLGGGREPCTDMECRVERAAHLAQFAALYSDRVYIHNFLSDHAAHLPTTPGGIAYLKQTFLRDVQVLASIRPFIEAGRIVPITTPKSWCTHCFGNQAGSVLDPTLLEGLANAGSHLRARFLREAIFEVSRSKSGYSIIVRGPEDLVVHGRARFTMSEKKLGEIPVVRARLLKSPIVRLSREEVLVLDGHKNQASKILQNVLFELTVSQVIGTSFLTERPIHVDIIQTVTSGTLQDRRNEVIQKHLTTLVPFLQGVAPEDMLRLRAEEDDSFIVFRKALNDAIDQVIATKEDVLTEADARQLYGDMIQPSIARLNEKVRSAERAMTRVAGRKVAAWSGAISFGILSGIVPAALQPAAQLLGLTKIASELTESALSARPGEDIARNEDLFFLWKVRKMSK